MKVWILIVKPLPSMAERNPRDKRPNFDVGAKLDREALGTACLVHGRKLGLKAPTIAIATDPSAACIEGAAALQRGFHPTNQWRGLPEVTVDDSSVETVFDPYAGESNETLFKAFIARLASKGTNIVVSSRNLPGWIKIQYGVEITTEGPLLVEAEMNDQVFVDRLKVTNLDGFSAERARSRAALSTPLGAAGTDSLGDGVPTYVDLTISGPAALPPPPDPAAGTVLMEL